MADTSVLEKLRIAAAKCRMRSHIALSQDSMLSTQPATSMPCSQISSLSSYNRPESIYSCPRTNAPLLYVSSSQTDRPELSTFQTKPVVLVVRPVVFKSSQTEAPYPADIPPVQFDYDIHSKLDNLTGLLQQQCKDKAYSRVVIDDIDENAILELFINNGEDNQGDDLNDTQDVVFELETLQISPSETRLLISTSDTKVVRVIPIPDSPATKRKMCFVETYVRRSARLSGRMSQCVVAAQEASSKGETGQPEFYCSMTQPSLLKRCKIAN